MIGKIAHSSTPIYNPTSPDKQPSVLNDLEKFICRNDNLDVIIKVALAEKAEISYNSGAATQKLLCELDIIKQSDNMARNRDYAYTEFLDCFIGEDMLENQHNTVAEHLRRLGNIEICGIKIDDGYSGLNCDRPVFQEFLYDIQ